MAVAPPNLQLSRPPVRVNEIERTIVDYKRMVGHAGGVTLISTNMHPHVKLRKHVCVFACKVSPDPGTS